MAFRPVLLLREPLVHFLALGIALFALHRACAGRAAASGQRRIVVDAAIRDGVADRFARTRGHPPTPEEREQLVSRFVDEQILFREGIARGLDRDDPRVRERVADKMSFVIRSSLRVPEPSAAELRAWFEQRKDRWERPLLVDFTHVFVEGDDLAARARAGELLARLQAGAEPAGLGDRFSGGRHYRRRRLDALAQAFGAEFVEGMAGQPEGSWAERRSRFGMHLVRIEARTAAAAADFESSRLEVEKDWKDSRRAEALEAAMRELRSRWQVVTRP
jgi:hypothetical protein